MSYKSLLNKIDELQLLVGDWKGVQPSQLEMDMALDRVKKIYEILRFSPLDEVQEPEKPESEDYVTENISVVPELEREKSINVTPEPEPTPEPELEPEPEPEPEIKVEVDEEEEMILDIDILKSANKERYNKILSLYCDLESQEPTIAPEPEVELKPEANAEPEPIKVSISEFNEDETEPINVTLSEFDDEVKMVVEPVIAPTAAQNVGVSQSVASHNTELYKISSQLGINDRFLLANDLFGGDISALSESLAKLDEFTNIDDVMIYIAENYKWDGDSEGAKLLYTLLQNRFF